MGHTVDALVNKFQMPIIEKNVKEEKVNLQ